MHTSTKSYKTQIIAGYILEDAGLIIGIVEAERIGSHLKSKDIYFLIYFFFGIA